MRRNTCEIILVNQILPHGENGKLTNYSTALKDGLNVLMRSCCRGDIIKELGLEIHSMRAEHGRDDYELHYNGGAKGLLQRTSPALIIYVCTFLTSA